MVSIAQHIFKEESRLVEQFGLRLACACQRLDQPKRTHVKSTLFAGQAIDSLLRRVAIYHATGDQSAMAGACENRAQRTQHPRIRGRHEEHKRHDEQRSIQIPAAIELRKRLTLFYGSRDLDASLLIMPLVFFMAPTDPRMLSTLRAILASPRHGGLVAGSMVYRYPPQQRIDGLPGEEGTFNMCSFWLVEALTRASQSQPELLDQARLFFENMLGYANHLGLYAEQTGPQGEALGNFPQAFTHLSLISAAFNLDRRLGSRTPGPTVV